MVTDMALLVKFSLFINILITSIITNLLTKGTGMNKNTPFRLDNQ